MTLPPRKSLRTRLTLWYVGVLAAILGLYIAAVLIFQYALLKRQMYHDEVQDMVTVEGLLRFNSHGGVELEQNYFSRPRSRLLVDRFMEVRDPSGTVLYRSPTLGARDLGGPPFPGEGSDSFNQRTVTLSGGHNVYLISHTHPVEGRVVLIRLGYSLAPLAGRMAQFFALLLFTLPLALVVAAFAGYGIAKRALAPLDAMASRAETITASNLHDRLAVPPEEDELGHMARVLNHLLERIERAFAEMKRFTADAAHELRTPLANQRVTGEIAMREKTDEAGYREAISGMLEETARLSQTIDSLLVLSKTEAQQPGESLSTFALAAVVDEVVHLLDVIVEERRITILQKGDNVQDTKIYANRQFVRLALMNVLHNAVKFSLAGGTIEVAYSTVYTEAGALQRVCVQDHGPGIEAGEAEEVFKRFYTGRSSKVKDQTGAGLGLSIARLAIERSHGRLFFDEAITSGARCCLELPLERGHPVPNVLTGS